MKKLTVLCAAVVLLASCTQQIQGPAQADHNALTHERDTVAAHIAQVEEQPAMNADNTDSMTTARDAQQEVADAGKQASHAAYFVVGSKSVLRDLGLIKGVFRQKADYANLDNSKFTKVDSREFKELNINSRKVKLITEKPANSYLLIENPDETTTLRITDPDAFWEGSPYLIIQTK